VLVSVLLPWLPGRAFSLKGIWLGLVFLAGVFGFAGLRSVLIDGWFAAAGWCLLVPATASFMALNFTGSTTYTSLSGVRRETRVAAPIQLVAALAGTTLWLVGRFV
jgi:hypothetical protein